MAQKSRKASIRIVAKPSEVSEFPWLGARGPGHIPQAERAAPNSKVGKWLLYAPRARVDEVWERIEAATRAGKLGCDAKVATSYDSPLTTRPGEHVLCIYTPDYDDHDDARRVLRELRAMGFADRISYKTNRATLAGVYGPGSAVYVSQAGSVDFEDRTAR